MKAVLPRIFATGGFSAAVFPCVCGWRVGPGSAFDSMAAADAEVGADGTGAMSFKVPIVPVGTAGEGGAASEWGHNKWQRLCFTSVSAISQVLLTTAGL